MVRAPETALWFHQRYRYDYPPRVWGVLIWIRKWQIRAGRRDRVAARTYTVVIRKNLNNNKSDKIWLGGARTKLRSGIRICVLRSNAVKCALTFDEIDHPRGIPRGHQNLIKKKKKHENNLECVVWKIVVCVRSVYQLLVTK